MKKMKKKFNKGFVLAETLVVTVFLMVLFTMIYSNFYPLIGEYEKRENYDDVDGKYAAYWMKKMIEDENYGKNTTNMSNKKLNMETYGYFRMECTDMTEDSQQKSLCENLVKEYEIAGCRGDGENCEVYVTNYRIGGVTPDFKSTVENNLKKYQEDCFDSEINCINKYIDECVEQKKSSSQKVKDICSEEAKENVFSSGFQDYIVSLPDYTTAASSLAKYRVIIAVQHTKDYNNYMSYATIEVSR